MIPAGRDSCPACRPGAPRGTAHHPVRVFTQFQSPDRIAGIVYEGADPADDPLWQRSGAASPDEYGRWCKHACGMACLQMVLHHRAGASRCGPAENRPAEIGAC